MAMKKIGLMSPTMDSDTGIWSWTWLKFWTSSTNPDQKLTMF